MKDLDRRIKEESADRKRLVAEAVDEVVERQPVGRAEVIKALDESFQRRGIGLSRLERRTLPDIIHVRIAPESQRALLGMKALGGFGFHFVQEIRSIFSEDRAARDEQE
jgi:hypothetical protein